MKTESKIKVIAKADGWEIKNGEIQLKKDGRGNYYGPSSYLTSHDAILPVIVKWCNTEGNYRWSKLFELGLTYQPPSHTYWFNQLKCLFEATPEQLSDALIKAMGKLEE